MHNAKKLSDALIIQPSYEIFLNGAPVVINLVLALIKVHPVDERRVILVRPLDDRCVGLDYFASQDCLPVVALIMVLCDRNMLNLDFLLLQGVDYCGLSFLSINVIFQRFIYLILTCYDRVTFIAIAIFVRFLLFIVKMEAISSVESLRSFKVWVHMTGIWGQQEGFPRDSQLRIELYWQVMVLPRKGLERLAVSHHVMLFLATHHKDYLLKQIYFN